MNVEVPIRQHALELHHAQLPHDAVDLRRSRLPAAAVVLRPRSCKRRVPVVCVCAHTHSLSNYSTMSTTHVESTTYTFERSNSLRPVRQTSPRARTWRLSPTRRARVSPAIKHAETPMNPAPRTTASTYTLHDCAPRPPESVAGRPARGTRLGRASAIAVHPATSTTTQVWSNSHTHRQTLDWTTRGRVNRSTTGHVAVSWAVAVHRGRMLVSLTNVITTLRG